MRNGLLTIIAALTAVFNVSAEDAAYTMRDKLTLFDKTVFYDGYRAEVVDATVNDGILRHSNYLYARPLKDFKIDEFLKGVSDLQLDVTIGARCDNYDRMGRVSIAFVPKNKERYNPEEAARVEIARFITPFMDKNKMPDEVPYAYEINDVRPWLLNDYDHLDYEPWIELEIFGIPYDANAKIEGCADRNDTFEATVTLSGTPAESPVNTPKETLILPVYHTVAEIAGEVNFNNFNKAACDTLGVTTRTFKLNVPTDLSDAQIVMILTNHGANSGGEEYIRRQHLVYFDKDIIEVYRPGGESCEPYRKYNTQKNGIYGSRPISDLSWQIHSNWCPGQAVPIRRMHLGAVKKGDHEFMIRVPEAEFNDGKGDFRPSIYLQGVEEGIINPSAVKEIEQDTFGIEMRREGETLHLTSENEIKELNLYSYSGTMLEGRYNPGDTFSLAGYPAGAYILVVYDDSGNSRFFKLVK